MLKKTYPKHQRSVVEDLVEVVEHHKGLEIVSLARGHESGTQPQDEAEVRDQDTHHWPWGGHEKPRVQESICEKFQHVHLQQNVQRTNMIYRFITPFCLKTFQNVYSFSTISPSPSGSYLFLNRVFLPAQIT